MYRVMTPQNTNTNVTAEAYITNAIKKGSQSGIIMLHENAHKCRKCKENLARLHFNYFHFQGSEGSKSKGEVWYYCDCQCGRGTITGWYRTKEEAIDAWNKGISLDEKTSRVEGR